MRSVPVADRIHWVGAVDWNLRDFHGYETPRGSTYNAYLVFGEDKIALVDTVKTPFVPELLSRIADLVEPERIDYIIVNHVEPDHNSGLRAVLEHCPNAKVFASKSGVTGVAEYHDGLVVDAVGENDELDLGGRKLNFHPVPMLHWPDSMFTWCGDCGMLMPNDGFGQHLASSERFADEVGMGLALEELGIYYANILMPVGKQVAKAVDSIAERGWDCNVIAPSHGVIWRGEDIRRAMSAYRRWSSGTTVERAVVAYSTMWGSTATMAASIADGIAEGGVDVVMYDLAISRLADITYRLLESRALVLGSSTIHKGMLYRAAGFTQYIGGLRPEGKLGYTFGSFGWGGGAVKQMRERLEAAGLRLTEHDMTLKYGPTDDDLRACVEWGRSIAQTVKDWPPPEERAAQPATPASSE